MNNSTMPRVTTQDWFSIISECRKSGLSDRMWCNENEISYSTFYYHVRRLQKEACELPEPERKCTVPIIQEVVPLHLKKENSFTSQMNDSSDAAVTLQINDVTMNISNHANAALILNTLKELKELC